MDQVRQVMRYHHYAYRTEKTYCDWIVRYIKFHGSKKYPRDMAKSEIKAFLSHLATHENVAASTGYVVIFVHSFFRAFGIILLRGSYIVVLPPPENSFTYFFTISSILRVFLRAPFLISSGVGGFSTRP
ncbi:MAG: phage integrase N-terminal SAM-like domain-containing protein, partial [Deltaproteobacteria bacterium]|nr:phage integrase N-terminal SAM-like domain-containing protein [Deltaproteobacteria bacterium]